MYEERLSEGQINTVYFKLNILIQDIISHIWNSLWWKYHGNYIRAADDRRPPVLTANRQLTVLEGSEARLTTDFLSAIDSESPSARLRYFIVEPPRFGYIPLATNKGEFGFD